MIENHLTLICHTPLGNEENPQTILISNNALPAHLFHLKDHEGACYENELIYQEFSDEFVTDNETLNGAIEILTMIRENLNADSDVGDMISEAAQLHKLFEYEDKSIKEAFQSAFKQFNKDVKAYYGDTQAVSETKLLHELDKTALKIQLQINKAEKEEQIKDKIQSAIQFTNAQEELQKIKNQIGLEKHHHETDNERLEALEAFELNLLKQTLFFTAKADGEDVSPELLESINEWAEEEIEENKNNSGSGSSNSGSGGETTTDWQDVQTAASYWASLFRQFLDQNLAR